jgi:anthranilate phosphoribosyltransferase
MPRDGTELEQMLLATGLGFVPESHAAPVLRRIAASVYPLALRDVGGFVNTIGPLLCPYRVSGQVIGVSRRDDFDVLAEAILALDLRRTLLVRSTSGMDELCSVTTNRAEWIDGHRLSIDIATEDLGFVRGTWQDLAGADAAHNAEALRGIIGGTRVGPSRDTVVLNAGAALLVAGVASSIADGVRRAARAIESGQALSKLNLITAWRGARDARNGARVCEPLEGP